MLARGRFLIAPLLLIANHAQAQCITGNGQSAPYASVRLVLPPGLPSAVQQAISGGINAWNATACNVGGDDFPRFVTSGTAGASISVMYVSGLEKSGACGITTTLGTDGSNATITLYSRGKVTHGEFDCFADPAVGADTFAHELGHYLGLADSGCSTYIMSPREYTLGSNGEITFLNNREIQTGECAAADDTNATPRESSNENSPPPDGGAIDPGPGAVDCCSSPIIIDLAGDGFDLSGPVTGVLFDLDSDGEKEQTAWTTLISDDAFLALDRNGNGNIDDGTELFGDHSPQPFSEMPNGYLALRVFDLPEQGGNTDGLISALDAIYSDLRLWIDKNHDGMSQPDELASLRSQGVKALWLEYLESRRRDRFGNQFRYWSRVERWGRRPFVLAVDVFLRGLS